MRRESLVILALNHEHAAAMMRYDLPLHLRPAWLMHTSTRRH